MFDFASSYTLNSFLTNYVNQHLIVVPVVLMVVAVVVIFFVRVKGEYVLKFCMTSSKHYDRAHYQLLQTALYGSLTGICILVMVGVLLNTTYVTPKLDNVIDSTLIAIQFTANNILTVESDLSAFLTQIQKGFNGTAIVGGPQTQVLNYLDNINSVLLNLSDTLDLYANNVIAPAEDITTQARGILTSLQAYNQNLTGLPSVNDIPAIDVSSVSSEVTNAMSACNYAINQVASIHDKVKNLNINVNLTAATGEVLDAIAAAVQARIELEQTVNQTNEIKQQINKYNSIRIGIIFTTYIVPLLIVLLGALAIQMRDSSIVRPWYHLLLVGVGYSSLCAAIYSALPVLIGDVCDSPQAAILATINSVDVSAENTTWYSYLDLYFSTLTHCNSNTYFLDYVNLPPQLSTLTSSTSTIKFDLSVNYTAEIVNATSSLNTGIAHLQAVNISFFNSTSIMDKLVNIQLQLANLSNFGFNSSLYNTSVRDIDALTSSIVAIFPNGTNHTYSIYYTSSNMSLLQTNAFPYNYTSSSYLSELRQELSVFNALDQQYHTVINLTNAINNNITTLMIMINTLESEDNSIVGLKQLGILANTDIDQNAADINQIISNLTNEVAAIILPQLAPVDKLWATLRNMTNCKYVTDVYQSAQNFVCVTVMGSSIAVVTTHLLIAVILCGLNIAASFAWICFRKPYKPFRPAKHHPTVALLFGNGKNSLRSKAKNIYVELNENKR